LWEDREQLNKQGILKVYELHWHQSCLYAHIGRRMIALPSIEGGLMWGVLNLQRSRLPRFTLADEDALADQLTWRNPDGTEANVWIIQQVDVRPKTGLLTEPGRGIQVHRRSEPRSEQRSEPRSEQRSEQRSERRIGVRSGLTRQHIVSGESFRNHEASAEKETAAQQLFAPLRFLDGTAWTEEVERVDPYQAEKPTVYKLDWKMGVLHVSYVRNGKRHVLLPSGPGGGFIWGTRAPRFFLAEEDIEENCITWRFRNGEVSHVWCRFYDD